MSIPSTPSFRGPPRAPKRRTIAARVHNHVELRSGSEHGWETGLRSPFDGPLFATCRCSASQPRLERLAILALARRLLRPVILLTRAARGSTCIGGVLSRVDKTRISTVGGQRTRLVGSGSRRLGGPRGRLGGPHGGLSRLLGEYGNLIGRYRAPVSPLGRFKRDRCQSVGEVRGSHGLSPGFEQVCGGHWFFDHLASVIVPRTSHVTTVTERP